MPNDIAEAAGTGTRHQARWQVEAATARMLALATLTLTLMPLWRTSRGWVRIWDFPRVQIGALGVLAQSLLFRWRRRGVLDGLLSAGVTAALVYQASKILPYTPLYRKQVPWTRHSARERRIRLLMVNVLQHNRRSDLVRQAIDEADADVICVVETDPWWASELASVERGYPWVRRCPLDNTYGMLLFSRLPIVACDTRFLVQQDVPSMRAVVTLPCGDEVVVHAIHPRPPLPDTPSYGRDAELVLTGNEVRHDSGPAVVIGDLNDVAWSYTTTLFQRISHMADPRVGRGMYNTFHAEHSMARYPLDHVFHTDHFTVCEIRRLRYTGSDHFPIVIELALTPRRTDAVVHPETSAEDRTRARRIVDEARDEETG